MIDIAILLSTHNSEIFLTEQIESIINQSYKNWTLYIRDDGSVDSTINLIEEYCKRNKNIIYFKDDKRLNAKKSFMWILSHVNSKYYMFCDQDDVWLPKKIELTLEKMINVEIQYPQKPILIHTDLMVVDSKLNIISNSFWTSSKLKPDILKNFNYIGVCNCATGCTVMINDLAKTISIPMPESAPMHDWWIASLVAKYGIIDYITQPTILYRQHQGNVVGAKDVSSSYFIDKLKNIITTIKGHIKLLPFHKQIKYGSFFKFYFYKIVYTIRRNL